MVESDKDSLVVALVQGIMLVGTRNRGLNFDYLEPAYHLQRGMMSTPRGTAIACQVSPIGMFAKWRRVDLAPGTPILTADNLTSQERKEIESGIRNAEEFRTAMTAAGAGIVTAGAGVKLPPMPGAR